MMKFKKNKKPKSSWINLSKSRPELWNQDNLVENKLQNSMLKNKIKNIKIKKIKHYFDIIFCVEVEGV